MFGVGIEMKNILALVVLFVLLSFPAIATELKLPAYVEEQYEILGSMPPLLATIESGVTPSQFYKNYQKSVLRAKTDQERASLALTAVNYWRNYGQITFLKAKTPDNTGVLRYRVRTEYLEERHFQILFVGDTEYQYQLLEELISGHLSKVPSTNAKLAIKDREPSDNKLF